MQKPFLDLNNMATKGPLWDKNNFLNVNYFYHEINIFWSNLNQVCAAKISGQSVHQQILEKGVGFNNHAMTGSRYDKFGCK